jgi:release factor glutamine methyltransferase
MNLIKQILVKISESISHRPVPERDAQEIIAHVLGITRTQLLTSLDREIGEEDAGKIMDIADKVASHYPLEYALGYAWFLGEKIMVNENVLIPRPDTETLVLEAKRRINGRGLRVLDLCTGSGCIALLVKKLCPQCNVVASDINPPTLEVAKMNADRMGLEVEFVQSDLYASLSGKFDMVLSNPPYIPSDFIATLEPEIAHEPRLALDGGTDGNDVYRRIAQSLPFFLAENGEVLLEIDCPESIMMQNVSKVFEDFSQEVLPDVSGRARVLALRRL